MVKVNGLVVAVIVVAMMLVALSVVSAHEEAPRQYGDGTKLWGIVDQAETNSGGKFANINPTSNIDVTLEVAGENDGLFSSFGETAQPQTSRFGSTMMSGYQAGTQTSWLQNFFNNWTFGR